MREDLHCLVLLVVRRPPKGLCATTGVVCCVCQCFDFEGKDESLKECCCCGVQSFRRV